MTVFKVKRVFIFFIALQFCWSCKTAQKSFYSYKVDTYGIDSILEKRMYTVDHLITFGDYLFEFRTKKITHSEINVGIDTIRTVSFDTTGIYLLSGKAGQYYEFDSFTIKSKFLSKGNISAKPSGWKLSTPKKTATSDTYYGPPKKVSINDIDCFYTDIISKDKINPDSVKQTLTLIKKRDFNSFYKIIKLEYPDSRYCIVGINMYHLKGKEYFIQEINNLRRLTKSEIKICSDMVKKAGL